MGSTEASTGIVGGGVLSGDSHPEDLARVISELSEQLHRARLLRRLLALWALPGNLVLIAAAVASFTVFAGLPAWVLTLVVVVPALSIVGSAILLYRQYFSIRAMVTQLRDLHRAHREQLLDDLAVGDLLSAHKRYRAQLPETISAYRVEARRYRRKHNALQSVVIAGSIATSVLAAVSVSSSETRWFAVAGSLLVAITAAFSGYSKFRERGMNLQQTADALERAYHSVELRVGRYGRFEDERGAYAEFAHEAEALLEEHAKRQQQLGPAVPADLPV